jgi:hypothetical protein
MGRPPGFEIERQESRRCRSSLVNVAWELSSALGRIALGIACFFLLLVVLRQYRPLRDAAAELIPKPIAAFFQADSIRSQAQRSQRDPVVDGIAKVIGIDEPGVTQKLSTTFGMGSSPKQVLAAQGAPIRQTERIWFYGQSEVYFAAGRVVGWRNSPSDPLRLR